MAVTRSRAAERAQASGRGRRAIAWRAIVWGRREAIWMLAGSLMLLFGFFLVYRAKTRSFAEIESGLAGKQLLNLNDLSAREDLLPSRPISPDPAERHLVARRIYAPWGSLPKVGALARLRV